MNLRIKIGRRKSDRIVPLLGLLFTVALACWASYSYLQAREDEKLNHNLQTVLREDARLRHIYEHRPTSRPVPQQK